MLIRQDPGKLARQKLLNISTTKSLVPSQVDGRLAAYVSSEFSSKRPSGEGESVFPTFAYLVCCVRTLE